MDELSGQFPDRISSDRLRELANRGLKTLELPDSDAIPALQYRDTRINSGGIADLQFVLMLLIEKSESGVDIVQLLTACLFLFNHCDSIISAGVKEAQNNLGDDESVSVLGELASYKLVFSNLLHQLSDLHMGVSALVTIERINRLRTVLGDDSTQADYTSHLLLSQQLLDCLGLDRDAVQPFIEAHQDT